MIELSYVSLFSGIEAFSVAASRVEGVRWNPVFFSEIDPFPCAVLAHHFPTVPNLGDICKIKIDHANNTATNASTTVALPGTGIDILAGGSPCQDVSVAGLRKGSERGSGTRSALFFEYARLVEELRPRILLFENVPGMLSSRDGRDFYAVQSALVDCGYSLAWRILDAQYTVVDGFPRAVPQRRKRVWLVGCLGGDGRVPAQILFERPSLLGDTPPCRTQGEGFAAPAGYGPARNDRVVGGAGFGETGQGFWQFGIQTLRADHQVVNWPSNVAVTPCGTGAGGDSGGRGDDAGEGAGSGGSLEVAAPLVVAVGNGQLNQTKPETVAKTLDVMHDVQVVCIGKEGYNIGKAGRGTLNISTDDVAQTIRADSHPSAVATFENHAQDSRVRETGGVAPTIGASNANGVGTGGNNPLVCVTFGKNGHAKNANGDGEKYAPVEVAQTLNTFQGQSDARAVDLVVSPSVCKTLSAEGFDGMPDVQKGNGMPVVSIGIDQQGGKGAASFAEGVAPTMASDSHGTPHAVAIGFKAGQSANGGLGDEREVAPTLSSQPSALEPTVAVGFFHVASGVMLDCQPSPTSVTLKRSPGGEGAVCVGVKYLASEKSREPTSVNVSQALSAGRNDQSVAIGLDTFNQTLTGDVSRTLNSAATDTDHIPVVLCHIVRRLTPTEAERLQAFPDGWTRIPYRGKPADQCPDSPRYRSLGNSMATNCVEWILRRIIAAFRLDLIERN